MQDVCKICGRRYAGRSFRLDDKPNGYTGRGQGTRALWRFITLIHVILFLFSAVIVPCPCGGYGVDITLTLYTGTAMVYFSVRFFIAAFKGYPILSRFQVGALLLLPVWGLAEFAGLFIIVRLLTHGGI